MRLRLSYLIPLFALATSPLAAQQASARGTVSDNAGNPLRDVQVLVTPASNNRSRGEKVKTLAQASTDSLGRFTIQGLPAGQPLLFMARKLGYDAAGSKPIVLKEGEVQELEFLLDKASLATVNVSGKRNAAYHMDSTAIAKLPVRNALGVVLDYKPRMLGDVYKMCSPDTSHLTFENPSMYRRPLQFRGGDPSHNTQFRLFINGIRHGERSAKDILADLNAEDIAEMNYVDCWDKTTPELQNSLLIVLKPGVRY